MLKIHPQDIGKVYAAYVDSEIGPKASSPVQKFWAYGSTFVVERKAKDYLSEPNRVAQLTTMGIMTHDGMIDLDFLRDMCLHAMEKSGGMVEAMGLILDKSDIEKVYTIGRSFAH